jgi:hypothetical protein
MWRRRPLVGVTSHVSYLIDSRETVGKASTCERGCPAPSGYTVYTIGAKKSVVFKKMGFFFNRSIFY